MEWYMLIFFFCIICVRQSFVCWKCFLFTINVGYKNKLIQVWWKNVRSESCWFRWSYYAIILRFKCKKQLTDITCMYYFHKRFGPHLIDFKNVAWLRIIFKIKKKTKVLKTKLCSVRLSVFNLNLIEGG